MIKQLFYLPVVAFVVGTISACGGSGTTKHVIDEGTPVTFVAENPTDIVAFQDGDGAWVPVAKDAEGSSTYHASVKDSRGKYGFAVESTN